MSRRDNRGNLQRQPDDRGRRPATMKLAPDLFKPLIYARFPRQQDIEKFVRAAQDIIGDKRFQDITGLELGKIGTNKKVRHALLANREKREELCVLASITVRGRRSKLPDMLVL